MGDTSQNLEANANFCWETSPSKLNNTKFEKEVKDLEGQEFELKIKEVECNNFDDSSNIIVQKCKGNELKQAYIVMVSGYTGLITGIIKNLMKVPRPQWLYPKEIKKYIFVTESTFATPSAHSSIIICVSIFYLEEYLQPEARYPVLIAVSLLVATSRMYFGVHYLQDVIIGLIIGYCFGFGFLHIYQEYLQEQITLYQILIAEIILMALVLLNYAICVFSWPVNDNYWQALSGQKEVIDPYSSRKSWYFLAMGSGLLGGIALQLYLNEKDIQLRRSFQVGD
ncbi:lipid phosphate [Stylonychia lemnae]|uniref:Lipid phosphate n=1 Tax=Stylonychia lemnae TaxID=5949 RepID=A0A078AEH6_STYLE|nr:lipid phosphate [Stylonychia lemnae]|eukprot:CDW79318.1 lipid phosphate [Stylonychia lemnae]